MKRLLTYLGFAIIGIGIGGYSALAMAGLLPGDRRTGGSIEIKKWYGDFAMGSEDASPYFRARIARHGLLALANTEAVYFTRTVDDSGRPFTEGCSYLLSGGTMPAQWWSVTLYDAENFLPDNTDNALSFDASRAEAQGNDNGAWSAIISAEQPGEDGGWISSKAAGNFDLTFRLYVPDDGVLEQPEEMIEAPSVERLACAGGAS
ncbi:DUF1214 domain-containing protein [Pontixanthobacter aestiaquae]|uniref:DUF1214 domain-containing protein n=1 Tax=Pontixanthobacter aestiaquae TaxID=1509367 RepID=A0A844Z5S1_9SPHN|nr:DUF1214 domain-containing protein [Pontixanthobacter aestiaquae]MDN3646404.1 DUF1214 domain-containing protein [Pontixanthobacter aestiaquae]MXO82606.1 DUF1214 domain-containing protein [Pontixanthobacter aestiaquae]